MSDFCFTINLILILQFNTYLLFYLHLTYPSVLKRRYSVYFISTISSFFYKVQCQFLGIVNLWRTLVGIWLDSGKMTIVQFQRMGKLLKWENIGFLRELLS